MVLGASPDLIWMSPSAISTSEGLMGDMRAALERGQGGVDDWLPL